LSDLPPTPPSQLTRVKCTSTDFGLAGLIKPASSDADLNYFVSEALDVDLLRRISPFTSVERSSPSRSLAGAIEVRSSSTDEDNSQIAIVPIFVVRSINRLFLLIFAVVCAIGVPCFGLVISFLGCGTVSILTYVMPPLLHRRIVTEPLLHATAGDEIAVKFETDFISPSCQYVIDITYCVFGILFCIVSTLSTGFSIYSQLEQEGGISSC
jgi:hypothetical protein